MEHATPEDPDAFAFFVEERAAMNPLLLIERGKPVQARDGELNEAFDQQRDGWLFGQKSFDIGFGMAHECVEKAAFGEDLVLHDVAHGGGFGVRLPGEIFIRKLQPGGGCLAGLG